MVIRRPFAEQRELRMPTLLKSTSLSSSLTPGGACIARAKAPESCGPRLFRPGRRTLAHGSRTAGPNADLFKGEYAMRSRSKIASIVLFLAALAVGFNAQPGWGSFNFLRPGYTQCDFPDTGMLGMVVLPDGRVLVATAPGLAYFPRLSSAGTACPTAPPTVLNTAYVYSLTIGANGKVYAFRYDQVTTKRAFVTVDPSTGNISVVGGFTDTDGLGLTLDPLTGDLFMTHVNDAQTVSRISHLYDAGPPTISSFGYYTNARLDGLAWSCDGTTLLVDRHLQLGTIGLSSSPAAVEWAWYS